MARRENYSIGRLEVDQIVGSGAPVAMLYPGPGKRIYVDSVHGSDALYDGSSEDRALDSLESAMDLCTASHGDVIFLLPGHAETTTAVALDVAGVTIIGVGVGRNRPTFTATTDASDLFDVTAANVRIQNIRLVGAASGVTSLISVAAADFQCIGCSLEHGAAPLIAVIVTGGIDRFTFKDCLFLGTAANPDCSIDLQGSGNCEDWTVDNCTFNYVGASVNLDEAGIRSDKTDKGVLIKDSRFIGMTLTAIDFNSSSTGLIERVSVVSLNSTVAELIDGGLMAMVDCRVAYQGTSGARIPATTATP